MLTLMFVSMTLILLQVGKMKWYQTIWSLSTSVIISMLYLNSFNWTFNLESCSILSDSMSSMLISLTLWISLMMLVASQASVKQASNMSGSFCYMILFLNLILIVTFCLSNVLVFYFMFEASLIPTLLLILGWGYQPERLQAGMYMMIYTVAASLPLLMTILWSLSKFGSLNMMMVSMLHKMLLTDPWAWNFLIFFILTAFLVKLPMFSVHLWLPKAHVEAPVAGSMVLAAILLKLGGYGILRVFQFFSVYIYSSLTLLLMVALWGGMLTAIVCFRQIDMKSLIAYSSIGHMSLMLAGAFSMTSWGWGGALALMLAHGFCSSALFSLANYTYEKTGTRSLFISKGMLMLIPILSMWWFLFSVLNMAAPPSINLLGEILIFPAIIFTSKWCIFPLALMSFLSALYSMYLYTTSQHGGSPKFLKPFSQVNSANHSLLALHWIPANLLILKPEMVYMWA